MAEDLDPEQIDRKSRSEASLAEIGVPINTWLPAVERAADTRVRTVEEIAQRPICLLIATA